MSASFRGFHYTGLHGHSKQLSGFSLRDAGYFLRFAHSPRRHCAVRSPHANSSKRRCRGERHGRRSDCRHGVQLDLDWQIERDGHGVDAERQDVRGRQERRKNAGLGRRRRSVLHRRPEFLQHMGAERNQVPSRSHLRAFRERSAAEAEKSRHHCGLEVVNAIAVRA